MRPFKGLGRRRVTVTDATLPAWGVKRRESTSKGKAILSRLWK